MKKLLLAMTMIAAFATVAMAEGRFPGGPQDQSEDQTATPTQGVGQVIEPTPAPDMVVRPLPDAGVEGEPRLFDAGGQQLVATRGKVTVNVGDDIVVRWGVLHGLRRPLHVHCTNAGLRLDRQT